MRALEEIAALVRHESGVVLGEPQFEALAAAVERVDPGGPERFARLTRSPQTGPALVARLLDEVTVKETFFLRDPDQLGRIDWSQLFRGASQKRPAWVWSAGCASGEEAYSLALLACVAAAPAPPPVRILATDISEVALALARAGVYRPRSTRGLDAAVRRRFFAPEGGRLAVGDELRSLVTFARHNLVHDAVPSPGEGRFDLVLCRNVLIYFDSETAARVASTLESALAPSGRLVLGAADALCRSAAALGRLRSHPARSHWEFEARTARGGSEATGKEPPADARRRRGPTSAVARADGPGDGPTSPSAAPSDALDPAAQLLDGLAHLEAGEAGSAVVALRRALYIEPRLGLAAFQLGRAYEALGDQAAARRAYEQALRTSQGEVAVPDLLRDRADLADVAAAARARLEALTAIGSGVRRTAGVDRPRRARSTTHRR